jgi:sulfur carrier protein
MRSRIQARRDILLNGEAVQTGAPTLAALLDEAGYGAQKVATAVNGDFVSERARATTRLEPGDRVEVVAARQGG